MENETTKLKDNQPNKYYQKQIIQLTRNAQLELEKLKNLYQKYLYIQSNEMKLRNLAKQKTREIVLLATNNENDEDDEIILQSLEKAVNKETKLQLSHRALLKALEEKTESGALPDYIQISFIALQSQSDQSRRLDHYNTTQSKSNEIDENNFQNGFPLLSSVSSSLSSCVPIESDEEEYVFGEFRELNPKHVFNSEPASPHHEETFNGQFSSRSLKSHKLKNNLENDNSKSEKQDNTFGCLTSKQRRSLNSVNLTKISKIMNLPKRTKFVMLNRASAISQYLERLRDITNLSNKVSDSQKKLKKLDEKVEKRKYQLDKILRTQNDQIEKKMKNHSIALNLIEIDLIGSKDVEIMTDPILEIETMKKEINRNAGEASQQFLAIQQLQDLQNYHSQLDLEKNVLFLSNDRKLSEFKTIIANLRAIDPFFYNDERRKSSLDPRLTQIKKKKVNRLEAIENKILEIQTNTDHVLFRINDVSFLIDNLKKQRMKMMQAPKADVRGLCFNLTNNRVVFNEQKRQISFTNVIKTFLDSNSMKLKERYSRQSLDRLANDNVNMEMKVNELKTRFDHLRAARENHSFVLTNEEEMKFLQMKVHDIISAIDVSKMRMNGLVSRVDKQMRLVNQQQIFLPEPPYSLKKYQEMIQKKKIKQRPFL